MRMGDYEEVITENNLVIDLESWRHFQGWMQCRANFIPLEAISELMWVNVIKHIGVIIKVKYWWEFWK